MDIYKLILMLTCNSLPPPPFIMSCIMLTVDQIPPSTAEAGHTTGLSSVPVNSMDKVRNKNVHLYTPHHVCVVTGTVPLMGNMSSTSGNTSAYRLCFKRNWWCPFQSLRNSHSQNAIHLKLQLASSLRKPHFEGETYPLLGKSLPDQFLRDHLERVM